VASEVEVRDLFAIPYAYQSFDPSAPAHIATVSEYRAMEDRYAAYWRKVEANRLRESRVNAQREEDRQELVHQLNAATNDYFERLQALQQAGQFRRHRHMVLNFIDAVEDLYERRMDGGFLGLVAGVDELEQRHDLMQSAYVIGWGGQDDINMQLILNLLERNGLVEVIDVVRSDDSDNDEDDQNINNEAIGV
jgi:hypothetical protein